MAGRVFIRIQYLRCERPNTFMNVLYEVCTYAVYRVVLFQSEVRRILFFGIYIHFVLYVHLLIHCVWK